MTDARLCAGCRKTLLSAYNQGPLCSPCEKETFSATYGSSPGTPVWVWGTAPMRRMLARLSLGPAVETFRLAAGMSQAEVGRITGWSRSVVGLIETGGRDTIYDVRNLLHMIDAFDVPREMLLPVILGHPAVFPSRRIACAEAALNATSGQPGTGYLPGEVMHIIAGKLKARGFEVTERTSGDQITEITVTNPRTRSTGIVRVDCDGYVTWEWLADFTSRSGCDQITERVTDLLRDHPKGTENSLRLVSGGTQIRVQD
jgi:transcriptional regulator with XRE-family HTH domain